MVHGDRVERVGDAGRDRSAGDFNANGIGEAPLREGLDGRRHGGGKEQRLAVIPGAEVDDFPDLRKETHVEHAVHFIEDEHLDFAKAHGGAVEMVDEAPGGGDDDVSACGELFGLGAKADAAIEQGDFHAGVFAVFFELFGDLVGEFAGGFEYEDLGFAHFGDLREGGEGEGGGFSGACLGGADDVLAFENNRNRLGLDWRWRGVTGFLNGFQNGCGEPKCVKSHTAA